MDPTTTQTVQAAHDADVAAYAARQAADEKTAADAKAAAEATAAAVVPPTPTTVLVERNTAVTARIAALQTQVVNGSPATPDQLGWLLHASQAVAAAIDGLLKTPPVVAS